MNFFVFVLVVAGSIVSTLLTGLCVCSIALYPHFSRPFWKDAHCAARASRRGSALPETCIDLWLYVFALGLTWAKFSIPKASTLVFSDNLLLTAFHGNRALIFRAVNNRTYGAIIEGSFRYLLFAFVVNVHPQAGPLTTSLCSPNDSVSVIVLNHRLGKRETHELKLVRTLQGLAT